MIGLIVVALALLCAPNAFADEQSCSAPCNRSTTRGKIWVALPLTELTWVNPGASRSGGALMVGGLSLEFEVQRFWAVELGAASILTSIEGTGSEAFVRAGVVPTLRDWTARDGRGWRLQLDALAGYRFLNRFDAPDGCQGTEHTHGVLGNLGVEFNHQGEHTVFGVRLLSGLTVPIAQTRTECWESYLYFEPSQDLRWALDLGVNVGITL